MHSVSHKWPLPIQTNLNIHHNNMKECLISQLFYHERVWLGCTKPLVESKFNLVDIKVEYDTGLFVLNIICTTKKK